MKIFVTVGTNEFDELIRFLDNNYKKEWKISAQIGNGKYEPKNFKFTRWLDQDQLINEYIKADLIICGHGAGTLFEILNLKKTKKILSVRQKNKEKIGDYSDLARELAKYGYIRYIAEYNKVVDEIEKMRTWKPKKYKKPECWIHRIINKFLN